MFVLPAEANEFDGNRAGRHFAVPVGHGAGKPYPLGPTLVSTTRSNNPQDVRCTMNFAVRDLVQAVVTATTGGRGGSCHVVVGKQQQRRGEGASPRLPSVAAQGIFWVGPTTCPDFIAFGTSHAS